MPEWLSISIAVMVPLASFAGMFFARGKAEQKVSGKIDLLAARFEAFERTISDKLQAIEKGQDDAKRSRVDLRREGTKQGKKLDSLRTVCKMTHPDRPMPDTVGGG